MAPSKNGVGVRAEDTRLCVVMVGLPARGKSYIAQKGEVLLSIDFRLCFFCFFPNPLPPLSTLSPYFFFFPFQWLYQIFLLPQFNFFFFVCLSARPNLFFRVSRAPLFFRSPGLTRWLSKCGSHRHMIASSTISSLALHRGKDFQCRQLPSQRRCSPACRLLRHAE